MTLIEHHFETQSGVMVHLQPYRLPEHKRQIVQKESAEMLKMGVTEQLHSACCRPIVLVVKKDGLYGSVSITARGTKCHGLMPTPCPGSTSSWTA